LLLASFEIAKAKYFDLTRPDWLEHHQEGKNGTRVLEQGARDSEAIDAFGASPATLACSADLQSLPHLVS
jgi:hypothetical protein